MVTIEEYERHHAEQLAAARAEYDAARAEVDRLRGELNAAQERVYRASYRLEIAELAE